MQKDRPSAGWRYGVAVTLAILAFLLRFPLTGILNQSAPYAFALFIVLFVAWWAGMGPALVATALSAFLGTYYIGQRGFGVVHANEVTQVLIFLSISLVTCWATNALQRGRERAEEAMGAAQRNWDQLMQSDGRYMTLTRHTLDLQSQLDSLRRSYGALLFSWTPKSDTIKLSEGLKRLLELSYERLPTDVAEWLQLVHAEDRAECERQLRAAAEGEEPPLCTCRLLKAHGGCVAAEIRYSAMSAPVHGSLEVVGVINDVTTPPQDAAMRRTGEAVPSVAR